MNKRFFFLSLITLLFLFFSNCVSKKEQIKKADLHHQLASSFMRKCDYPSALKALKKALTLQKNDPFLHHSIALLYFQFKKYQKVIHHLTKTLKLKPDFTAARVHLGRTFIEINKPKKGLEELKKAKDDLTYNQPENIHTHIGLAYYNQKNFLTAEKHFSVARTVKKETCFTALYHAKAFYFLGEFQKALDILEPAKVWCEINLPLCSKPSFEPYYFAALAYGKKMDSKNALFNMKTFLERTKKNEYKKQARKYIKMWKGTK